MNRLRSLRYRLIRLADWLDDRVLRHRLYRLGVCRWLAESSWWGAHDA